MEKFRPQGSLDRQMEYLSVDRLSGFCTLVAFQLQARALKCFLSWNFVRLYFLLFLLSHPNGIWGSFDEAVIGIRQNSGCYR